jgi:hypothetical protein
MDEIDLVRAARPSDTYPAPARAAARARLDAAIAGAAAPATPEPASQGWRPRRRVRRVAVAGALAVAVAVALTVTQQLSRDGAPPPAAPAANAAELADRAAAAATAHPAPTPGPHQWVYSRQLRVEHGGGEPFSEEHWARVDGRKLAYPISDRRVDHAEKVVKETRDYRSMAGRPGCPDPPDRIPPAVGLGRFFPDPAAVPTDPDGLLAAVYRLVQDPACAPALVGDTVQDRAFSLIDGMLQTLLPAEVRAALFRALAKIPGVTVVQGATDAAGRRGVAFARAAAIEGPGSSDWLRLEIILDRHAARYLGARQVVTRDHFLPDTGRRGTWLREGQVLVSRAQLALGVVDAPCRRPGETTTCASSVETTWVLERDGQRQPGHP